VLLPEISRLVLSIYISQKKAGSIRDFMNNREDTAHNLQPKAIDKAGIPLLGEAVKRMRRGNRYFPCQQENQCFPTIKCVCKHIGLNKCIFLPQNAFFHESEQ